MGFEKLMEQYFFIIIPIFWILIMSLTARISGWRALAEVYPVQTEFTGPKLRFQSASLRWSSNYSGIVNIGANAQGFYLSVIFLFRPGHPPLFIPWNDIRVETREGFIPALRLNFARKPNIPFVISKGLGERLAQMSGGRFRIL